MMSMINGMSMMIMINMMSMMSMMIMINMIKNNLSFVHLSFGHHVKTELSIYQTGPCL